MSDKIKGELIEWVSEIVHNQWANWAEYILDNMTEENIKRWRRQIETSYEDLSEEEKDSDRYFAKKYVHLMYVWLDELITNPLRDELKNERL